MKIVLLAALAIIATFHNCESAFFGNGFVHRRMSIFRRPKIERVSCDGNITVEDKRNAKELGPNVCPDRVFLGSSYSCTINDGERNCSRKIYYRTRFRCCPGYREQTGKRGCPLELYTSSKNITEVLKDLGLTTFIDLAKQAGLSTILMKTAPLTVFSPTNEAFAAFPNIEYLKNNQKKLSQLLLYHIISGKIPTTALEDEGLLKTLNAPNSLRVNVFSYGRIITVQGARVLKENQGASNGIVYVISKVVTPPSKSVLELMKENPELSTAYQNLMESGIKLKGPITVFAPSNKAFEKADSTMKQLKFKACKKNLMNYHLIDETVYTTILLKGYKARSKTREGGLVSLKKRNGTSTVNTAKIITSDISSTDGVLHIIDKVLIPNSALPLLQVVARANASEIVKLMKSAGLDSALTGKKEFTLFAPSDEAIRSLPAGLRNSLSNPKVLKDILLYHLIEGRRGIDSFENEELLDTLATNKSLRANMYNYGRVITIQGGRILPFKFDLKACNGIVHVINKVLFPPKGTLADIIEANSDFSTFSSLLDKAGLKELLRKRQSLTVFAPVNQAFFRVSKAKIQRLLEDDYKLQTFLKYHIFQGTLFSPGLWDGCNPYSLNGEAVSVKVTDSEIKINDALVKKADVSANNGVLHVVDSVLQTHAKYIGRFFPLLPFI